MLHCLNPYYTISNSASISILNFIYYKNFICYIYVLQIQLNNHYLLPKCKIINSFDKENRMYFLARSINCTNISISNITNTAGVAVTTATINNIASKLQFLFDFFSKSGF